MYFCCGIFSVSVLLATSIFSANCISYARDDTFEGIKLYNSLEQALFAKYANKPNGMLPKRPKTEPIANGLGDYGEESILDENHLNAAPAIAKSNHYTNADHEAFIKITKALYKRPVSEKYGPVLNDEHSKNILNGVLVAQLQSLLDSNRFLSMNEDVHNDVYNIPVSKPTIVPTVAPTVDPLMNSVASEPVGIPVSKAAIIPIELTNVAKIPGGQPKEHLFLVLNDELKTVTKEELIYVDPDSLSDDSTVFVLGSLNDMFSNDELAALMGSVQTELLKPKYLPLLYTLSSGKKLQALNAELGANIYSGANARRYVKAHRCNYQSPLAKIKNGGPMWVICSGYLNINTPSFYDK